MFKKSPSDLHFLIVTFLVVLLLGGPTVWSVVGHEAEEVSAQELSAGESSGQGGRAPASLSPMKPSKISPLAVFDVSCVKGKGQEISVTEHFVQIRGKNCLKAAERERIEIVNQSNGYTASVFLSGTDQYQTDLIQLNKGPNEIHIRYPSAQGLIIEEVLKVNSSQI